jgi:hypothetical protein
MMNSKSISTTNKSPPKRPYNINNNDDSDIPTSFSDLQISSMFSFVIINCLLVICLLNGCWNIIYAPAHN